MSLACFCFLVHVNGHAVSVTIAMFGFALQGCFPLWHHHGGGGRHHHQPGYAPCRLRYDKRTHVQAAVVHPLIGHHCPRDTWGQMEQLRSCATIQVAHFFSESSSVQYHLSVTLDLFCFLLHSPFHHIGLKDLSFGFDSITGDDAASRTHYCGACCWMEFFRVGHRDLWELGYQTDM